MKDLINEIEITDRWMAEQFQRHDYRQMYEIWNKFKENAMTQVKNLSIHDVIVSDFCECTYIRHNDTWTTEDGKVVCCHCHLPKQK